MSETISFDIEKRNEELNPRQVRAEGNLPGTIYGKGMESVSIQLNRRNFINIYKNNKEAVYELKGNDLSYKAVVKNLQCNYATQEELNVEFQTV